MGPELMQVHGGELLCFTYTEICVCVCVCARARVCVCIDYLKNTMKLYYVGFSTLFYKMSFPQLK